MKYTFDGNASAESIIGAHQRLVVETVRRAIPEERLAAIVMIGGYGREEGAYVIDSTGEARPYNDYDYFVVYRNTSAAKARALTDAIPDLEHETGIEVDFFPLLERDIPSLEFSLMNAEMRAGHVVIWGASNILQAMPEMPLDEVPMSEFERLLTNRGCLLLMNCLRPASEDFSKFINKAWLAIGDTELARVGAYHLSYLTKREVASRAIQNPTIRKNYQRAIDIRMRPDAYAPWGQEDLPMVVDCWLASIEALRSISKPASQGLYSMLKNVVRHLRDRRLRLIDSAIIEHPRRRITDRLPSLLEAAGGKHSDQYVQQAGGDLLDLWGSYS